MSLVNDALKRAKEVHQQTSQPPPDLPLRPIEPGQQRGWGGLGLLLSAALAVVALLALFLVWRLAQTRPATKPIEATARTAQASTTASPASAPVNPAATTSASASQPDWSVQPTSAPLPVTPATDPLAGNLTAGPINLPVPDAQEGDGTNARPAVVPAPPKPAPLRLQAIVFNPKRPSAMISGKTVFVGDRLGTLRVVAIDQDTATLAGGGQTNVLSLSE
jgi:hypothetical protein